MKRLYFVIAGQARNPLIDLSVIAGLTRNPLIVVNN
jgi:hypothetical protein